MNLFPWNSGTWQLIAYVVGMLAAVYLLTRRETFFLTKHKSLCHKSWLTFSQKKLFLLKWSLCVDVKRLISYVLFLFENRNKDSLTLCSRSKKLFIKRRKSYLTQTGFFFIMIAIKDIKPDGVDLTEIWETL